MNSHNVTYETNRIAFLDYLRLAACLMVILVHSCEFYYCGSEQLFFNSKSDLFWVSLVDGTVRSCVPLFVMISGFLLLPVRQTTGNFLLRRLVRVIVPAIVWVLLYASLPYLWGELSLQQVATNLLKLPFNFLEVAGHLWFVLMIVGVYLIMPIISPWLDRIGHREESCYIGLWGVTTLWHYLRLVVPSTSLWGDCVWNEFHTLYYVAGFGGYVLLAHYLKRYMYEWSVRMRLWFGMALFIVGAALTVYGFYYALSHSSDFYYGEIPIRFCTINVAMAATGLFLLFGLIRKGEGRIYAVVKDGSRLSYGIYLMHIFILNAVHNLLAPHLSTACSIFIVGIVTFILSWGIAKLLSFVPHSKYIIG